MMSYPYEIDFENIYLFTMKTVTNVHHLFSSALNIS